MEIPYAVIWGLAMVSLSLDSTAKPLAVVQDQVPAANHTANLTVTEVPLRANASLVELEPDPDVAERAKNPPSAQRKPTNRQTNKQTSKSEKRTNCFGFKMDRISDLSGMGCKKDGPPPGQRRNQSRRT